MKGWDNSWYVTLLIVANTIALLQLFVALKWPRIAKLSFALQFAWAAWINWRTALVEPTVYLEYAELALLKIYAGFILGWFATHTVLIVGCIATCQAFIAVSMLTRGGLFRAGCVSAIIFLLSILPLGVGAGFPSTFVMALACFILLRKDITNETSRREARLASF